MSSSGCSCPVSNGEIALREPGVYRNRDAAEIECQTSLQEFLNARRYLNSIHGLPAGELHFEREIQTCIGFRMNVETYSDRQIGRGVEIDIDLAQPLNKRSGGRGLSWLNTSQSDGVKRDARPS